MYHDFKYLWLVVSLICFVAFLLIPVYFRILKRRENKRRKKIVDEFHKIGNSKI